MKIEIMEVEKHHGAITAQIVMLISACSTLTLTREGRLSAELVERIRSAGTRIEMLQAKILDTKSVDKLSEPD